MVFLTSAGAACWTAVKVGLTATAISCIAGFFKSFF